MVQPDQISFGMSQPTGVNFAVLSHDEPVFHRDFNFHRVIIPVEKDQNPTPAIAIGMVTKLISDHPGNIMTKKPELCPHCLTIGDPESRVLMPHFDAASHEIHQYRIFGLAVPVNLIDVVG